MATTAYKPGRNLVIYWNGVPVGCSKTASIEITTSTSDSTTKCDVVGGVLWANNTPQKNSFTITDNGMVPVLTSAGMATEKSIRFFQTAQIQQVKGYATVIDSTTGDILGGDVWVTSSKLTGETESDQTYDVTLTGTGPLSLVAVS
jgi:hypothetical protein